MESTRLQAIWMQDFIEHEKALDTVSHILLEKLNRYGVRGISND